MAVRVAAWCERLLLPPAAAPHPGHCSRWGSCLGSCWISPVSVSEHPIAGLGLRGGSVGPAVGRGL